MKKLLTKLKAFFKTKDTNNIYKLDGCVPLTKAIPFGLQHVLSMFVANITPILIVLSACKDIDSEVAMNAIRSAIFIAGVGTIIQLFPIWKIGSKLPIVVGISFTFVGVLASIGGTYGYGTMITSIIIGGIVIGILGLFAKYWKKFIKPIVSSTVVFAIGLSLLIVGAQQFIGYNTAGVITDGAYNFQVGSKYLIVACITLIISLTYSIVVKGVWKNINILVGLVCGYIVSLCLGIVDFSNLTFTKTTDFINIPRLVQFDLLRFDFGAVIAVIVIYIVASTEGIGDLSALANTGLNRDATEKEISGGIACDGFVSSLSGCFGALPLTTFSQNVGLVGQTKVVNRFTILMGAIILVLASLFPPIAKIIQTIPEPVLGGCMIMLFASICVIGMEMISKLGFTKKNVIILSLSIGLGYGITLIPEFFVGLNSDVWKYVLLIAKNPVANMFIISLILSYIIPEEKIDEGVKNEKD